MSEFSTQRPERENSTYEAISPGRKKHFANNEKIIYLRKMCWLGRMEHIPKKSHCARCPALELLCNSLCGLPLKNWRALVYVNWIDSHRPVDKGVNVGNCRMNRVLLCVLLANWYHMRGSSQQGLQLTFDRFSAACDQKGTKISSKKIEVLFLAQGSVSWADA